MKVGLGVVAIVGLLSCGAFAQEFGLLPPQVAVTGEASVGVVPDVARFTAGVVTEAKTAREAAANNNTLMTAVMSAIKAAGVADRDVQTSGYSVMPVIANNSGSPPSPDRITGFRVTNSVALTLHSLDKVGSTIDAVTAAGANTLGGVEFTVADESKALDAARIEAMADARRKAELYAKAAGATLGGVLEIRETVGRPGPVYQTFARAAAAPPPPIAGGELTLRVSILARFGLAR